jgi:hypothetical protein
MIGSTAYVAGGCCIDRFIYAGYPDNPPVLSWAGVDHYKNTGLYPMENRPGENVTFKIKYADPDGDPPIEVAIHVLKNGTQVWYWPMSLESGDPLNGAVYTKTWLFGADGDVYTHYFSAKDKFGAAATGNPPGIITSMAGPSFSNGVLIPADLAANLPDPGKIQVRNSIVKVSEGGRGYAVIRSRKAGAKVNVNLYSSAGRPVTGLGGGPLVTDDSGILTVEINGLVDGKPLPSGLYWVVVTGDVNDKQAIVIVSGK